MSATTSSHRATTRRAALPNHMLGASSDERRDRSTDDRETRQQAIVALEPHWVAAIESATD